MRSFLWTAAIPYLVGLASATTYPVIEANLTMSVMIQSNISRVDSSKSVYDRTVLEVDGEPFSYNGVQVRADNLQILWGIIYN